MSTRDIFGNTQGFKRLNNRTTPVALSADFLAGPPPTSPPPPTQAPWYRNPSWLPLPTVGPTEQKIVGVYAVSPTSNYVQFILRTGSFRVDWGDGVVEDFAGSTTPRTHVYDFQNPLLAGTNAPVTFQDTGDTVTRNNHGYTNGMTISFAEITSTTGISVNTLYYVVGATTNTFQVSLTLGGAALPLTTNGTGVILPYKQAIISITSPSNNMTSITLNGKDFTAIVPGLNHNISVDFLDLIISGPLLTTCELHNPVGQNFYGLLEQVDVRLGAITSLNSLLASSVATNPLFPVLANVVQIDAPNATSALGVLSYCPNLESVGTLNLPKVLSFGNFFQGCVKLRTAPVINTSTTATNINTSNMFIGCTSLTSFADTTFTRGANELGSMFDGCTALQEVPLLDLTNASNMGSMFVRCRSLTKVALLNTANVTSMIGMFDSCSSLRTVPLFNTQSVTSMLQMFRDCVALQTVPLFNTQNVTSTNAMFQNCTSLQEVPLFNTQNVTNMGTMFSGCTSLQTVPLFNTANVTSMASMFSSCVGLAKVPLFNTANVTGMSGMLSSCAALQEVPPFNTEKVTDVSFMFNGCTSLTTVPAFNLLKVTSGGSMFNGCRSLRTVPDMFYYGTPASRSSFIAINGLFSNCLSLQKGPPAIVVYVTGSATANNIFNACAALNENSTITIDSTNGPVDLASTFTGCLSLQQLVNPINIVSGGISGSTSNMFFGCTSLKTVPLFNTQSVSNMATMFSGCSSLITVPLFNTQNVTSTLNMFLNCFSLKTVPGFNLVKVNNMSTMYSNCYALENVDPFITSSAVNINLTSMFLNCRSLKVAPLFNTGGSLTISTMFSGCTSLTTIPAYDFKFATTATTPFLETFSLRSINCSYISSLNITNNLISVEGYNIFFDKLLPNPSGLSITYGNSPGIRPGANRSATFTSGSKVINITNTSTLEVGMAVVHSNATARSVSFTGNPSNLVNLTNHQLPNGTRVAFRNSVTTTGITLHSIYYVINATANSFQISTTAGGSPVILTNNGTGGMVWENYVESINPNVSITTTNPAIASATTTGLFYKMNVNIPFLKQWGFSGL